MQLELQAREEALEKFEVQKRINKGIITLFKINIKVKGIGSSLASFPHDVISVGSLGVTILGNDMRLLTKMEYIEGGCSKVAKSSKSF